MGSIRWLAALVLLAGFAGIAAAAESPRACNAPVHRQFDFFAGDWDTHDLEAAGKIIARNRVEIILDGCVVHEDYRQNDGLHGESYSLYDAARGVWHQSWVTNRGELLLMDGGWRDGRMTFEGMQQGKDGKPPSRIRVVWIPQGADVRETATRSDDGGRSWRSLFDIVFKPHRQ